MLFAIVQGGLFSELRNQSAEYLTALDFDGYALGGLSLGEPKEKMLSIIKETTGFLPPDKPRYLMGVGSPEDIIEGVARGIDIFDCVLPTRVLATGHFLPGPAGTIYVTQLLRNDRPFMEDCNCYTCRNFYAAYLHHLFNAGELLAYRLATIHNLYFMQTLTAKIRKAILSDSYASFRDEFRGKYMTTDEITRLSQKEKWVKNRGKSEALNQKSETNSNAKINN